MSSSVFLLSLVSSYEGASVLGVFSSREAAEVAMASVESRRDTGRSWLEVSEMPLLASGDGFDSRDAGLLV